MHQTASSLLREVARLHGQIQRDGVACCGGTTSTQCTILTELGHGGPMTLAELGRRLGVDKGWVSRAVEAMAQEGLLAKKSGTADKRTITITLTPAGQERFLALNVTLNTRSLQVMSRIPAAERSNVLRALELLLQAMKAEAEHAPRLIALEEDVQ